MTALNQHPIKVLLVERAAEDRPSFEGALDAVRGPALEVEVAGDLAAALDLVGSGGVDVILLDLELPDSEGLETFERVSAFAPDVPIVVLTERDDDSLAVATVQGGAQDYLLRSEVDPALVARSLRYAIERHRLMSALRSLSLIDDLTGLYNRRGFLDLGEQYVKLVRRSNRSATLVFIDLDRFKSINDTLGHQTGDRALLRMAELLRANFRQSDILARIGGDEFAVLALDASREDSAQMVERLYDRIVDFNSGTDEPFGLEMSLGTARYEGGPEIRLHELLAKADAAMYAEKRRKRMAAR